MPAEMITFQKYGVLPSELRSHVLSYSPDDTLYNYAQLSKVCNKEVQKFNTQAPKLLKLEDIDNGVLIKLRYTKNDRTMTYNIRFLNRIPNSKSAKRRRYNIENGTEMAAAYLKNLFKHVKNGESTALEIDMRQWPSEIMAIQGIQKSQQRNIKLYESMFEDFYEFIKNEDYQRMKLKLEKNQSTPFEIPEKFFETSYFQNLTHFNGSSPLPEFGDRHLLNMKITDFSINSSSVTEEGINQKIREWFANPPALAQKYSFCRTYQVNPIFNQGTLLRNLPTVGPVESDTVHRLRHSSGVKAKIEINSYSVKFYVECETSVLYHMMTCSKYPADVRIARNLLSQQ